MKNLIRFLCLALILVLTVAALAACGDKKNSDGKSDSEGTKAADGTKATDDTKSGDDTKAAEVAGEKQTWGQITVFVPSEMTLKGGDMLNADDKDKLTLSKTDDAMHYINIAVVDEESAINNVDVAKEMNAEYSPEDIEIKTGELTWTGISYNSLGYDCFTLYAKSGESCIYAYGTYALDSDIANAVLSSIEITPAE